MADRDGDATGGRRHCCKHLWHPKNPMKTGCSESSPTLNQSKSGSQGSFSATNRHQSLILMRVRHVSMFTAVGRRSRGAAAVRMIVKTRPVGKALAHVGL